MIIVLRCAEGESIKGAEEKVIDSVARWIAARPLTNVRRNDPCPCGSGRNYKPLLFDKDEARHQAEKRSAERATDNFIGGRASVANRALQRVNEYRRPRPK